MPSRTNQVWTFALVALSAMLLVGAVAGCQPSSSKSDDPKSSSKALTEDEYKEQAGKIVSDCMGKVAAAKAEFDKESAGFEAKLGSVESPDEAVPLLQDVADLSVGASEKAIDAYDEAIASLQEIDAPDKLKDLHETLVESLQTLRESMATGKEQIESVDWQAYVSGQAELPADEDEEKRQAARDDVRDAADELGVGDQVGQSIDALEADE